MRGWQWPQHLHDAYPMDLESFRQSLSDPQPPQDASLALKALWHESNGDWDKAHDLCNEAGNVEGDWVHAYLHRVEGDLSNADYWYRRAGHQRPAVPTDQEWSDMVADLLTPAG